MTFTILKTPDSLNYREIKRLIIGPDFPWYWTDFTVMNAQQSEFNTDGFYSHVLVGRPRFGDIEGQLFPTMGSQWTPRIVPMIEEIFALNQIPVNCVYRINANCVHPGEQLMTPPHVDHQFPHKNMLVYLTDAGGPTILTDESFQETDSFHPEEDDIVVFEGWHGMIPPTEKRRIVLVVTFS